jgi:hypothetical protein
MGVAVYVPAGELRKAVVVAVGGVVKTVPAVSLYWYVATVALHILAWP